MLHLRASIITEKAVPNVPRLPNSHADSEFRGDGLQDMTARTVPIGPVSENNRPTTTPMKSEESDEMGRLGRFSTPGDTRCEEIESEVCEWSA